MTIETLSAVRSVEIMEHNQTESWVRSNMGRPLLSARQVPMDIQEETAVDYPLPIGDHSRLFTCLYTGSTHAVTFLSGPVEEAVFQAESPLVEHHPLFPLRTSVIWAWPEGENRFRIRIWERGVGETLGCGTGACATAVAARLKGLVSGPAGIASRGGSLQIEWDEEIRMAGPAAAVFRGEFPIDLLTPSAKPLSTI